MCLNRHLVHILKDINFIYYTIIMESQDFFTGSRSVIELKPSDFDEVKTWTLKKHKCSIVMFYCAWCPHCQAMRETWEKVADMATFFDVCAFNCEKHKAHVLKMNEDMTGFIEGYPTIIIYKNGEPFERYEGDRSVGALLKVCMKSCRR